MYQSIVIGLVGLCLMSCGERPDKTTGYSMTPRQMNMWSRSCALCHVDGNAGAPRVGHADAWSERLAQPQETMLKHTLEGLNNMPALGYCMACERQDFQAMIHFMTQAEGQK